MTQSVATAIKHLAAHDPIMAELIDLYPEPLFTRHPNYYRELMSSIISQQLSIKAAAAIQQRFIDLFGYFPTPEEILATPPDDLRAVGLSRQKASYLVAIAEHARDKRVDFTKLDQLSDTAIIDELTSIKGVGIWTVHMLLIFCMARLDVLPVGDLGIRRAIERAYELPGLPTPDQVTAIAEQRGWHPYTSVASRYLWLSLDNQPK
jgi:DNA-3-methyladenine glycosylase II